MGQQGSVSFSVQAAADNSVSDAIYLLEVHKKSSGPQKEFE